MVYARDNVSCKRRMDLEDSNLEHIWLEIRNPNAKSFLLCIPYRQPCALVSWNDLFESNIEKVQLEDKEILIMGDFNKDLVNCRIKEEWLSFNSSLGLSKITSEPTRVCSTSSTLIDHIYSDNAQNII